MDFAGTLLFSAIDAAIHYINNRGPVSVRSPSPFDSNTDLGALTPVQKACYDKIVKTLLESCKAHGEETVAPECLETDEEAPKFHVISFQKPTNKALRQTVLICEGLIRQILQECDEDLSGLSETKIPDETCQNIIDFMKKTWRDLDSISFNAVPDEWKGRWKEVNAKIEAVPTNYPHPSSASLEAWKTAWLRRIRNLKMHHDTITKVKMQMNSEWMDVRVNQVKEQASIERIRKVKTELDKIRITPNQKHNLPIIGEFDKGFGIDNNTVAIFIIRVEEIVRVSLYKKSRLTRPVKLGMENPRPTTTSSQALLIEHYSVESDPQTYDDFYSLEEKMHNIMELALAEVNRKLAEEAGLTTKKDLYDAARHGIEVVKIKYPDLARV